MSYIIKNSTQGAIVARLTDAGRRKLSEGKLNIGLFQIGDSEVNYDCYAQQPAASPGLFFKTILKLLTANSRSPAS